MIISVIQISSVINNRLNACLDHVLYCLMLVVMLAEFSALHDIVSVIHVMII